jgi:outer membrane protein assembly factor BamA
MGAVLLVQWGCGGAQVAPGTTNQRVRSVNLVGMEGFSALEITDLLETRSSLQPNLKHPRLNPYVMATDIQRIETFLRTRGYLDARITGYEVVPREREERVDVTFEVAQGDPWYIRTFDYDLGRLGQIDPAELTDGIRLGRGVLFNHNELEAARSLLRRRLYEASYAFARVDVRVYADRDTNTVSVFIFVDSGVSCVFGEVDVEGNRQIPSDDIISRLRFRTGQNYRGSRLRLSQIALYDMGAFNFVSVEPVLAEAERDAAVRVPRPDGQSPQLRSEFYARMASMDEVMAAQGMDLVTVLSDAPRGDEVKVAGLLDQLDQLERVDNEVPVLVTVSENPGASYRVGGGIGLLAGRSETYARARATFRNAIAPLNQIELDGRLGYAWLPTILTPDRDIEGIIGRAQAGFVRPGFLRAFDLQTRVSYERNLQEDYAFRRPSLTLGATRRLSEFMQLQAGFSVDIMLSNDTLESTGGSCQAVPDQFRLVRFDSTLVHDRRDQPLAARRGYYMELATQVGIDGPIGEFSYLRVGPDVRYYQPMGRRLSTALRVSAGGIVDFGGDVPRSQCLYLGGGDTIRGFPQRRLSPYDGDTPVGGLTSWMFNVEPRLELARGWLFGVVFLDGGSVSAQELDFNFGLGGSDGLHLAAGGGLRLVTPIGPFRFDLGYRLTDAPQYTEFLNSRLAFFVSIGEAF